MPGNAACNLAIRCFELCDALRRATWQMDFWTSFMSDLMYLELAAIRWRVHVLGARTILMPIANIIITACAHDLPAQVRT